MQILEDNKLPKNIGKRVIIKIIHDIGGCHSVELMRQSPQSSTDCYRKVFASNAVIVEDNEYPENVGKTFVYMYGIHIFNRVNKHLDNFVGDKMFLRINHLSKLSGVDWTARQFLPSYQQKQLIVDSDNVVDLRYFKAAYDSEYADLYEDYKPYPLDTTKIWVGGRLIPRRIVASVCRFHHNGEIIMVQGVRHYCPLMRKTIDLIGIDDTKAVGDDQGFIDQYGIYVNRKEAKIIAETNDQQLRAPFESTKAFSENFW